MTQTTKYNKTAANELRKLSANFFNTIAAGCVLVGLIAPVFAGRYCSYSTGQFVPLEIGVWVMAAVFHIIGRLQLWFLDA